MSVDKHLEILDGNAQLVRTLNNVADDLYRLGSSFYMTGNEAVAVRLTKFCNLLNDEADALQLREGQRVSLMVQESEQATMNLMNGVLAVVMKK